MRPETARKRAKARLENEAKAQEPQPPDQNVILAFNRRPPRGETAAPLFILGNFVEAFVGERSPFEEVAL